MGALSHVKSNPIPDFTGTVTAFNSQGSTVTVNATDLVRPSDWNSAHNIFQTLSGNTAGQSSMSGTNLVWQGGNNVTLSGSTAAGAATVIISAANQSTQTQASGNIAGVGTTFNGTNASASLTLNSVGLRFDLSVAPGGGGGGVAMSAGTQSVSTGTVAFANSNGITFGMSGSSQITASHNGLTTQTVQTQASGNIVGSGFTSTTTAGTAVVGTLNSQGLSIGVPTIVTNALTSQSNQAVSGTNGSLTFQTLTLGALNGLSFYTSNGSVVGSYTVPTQTAQTLGLYASSNTTGQSSSTTVDARSLSVRGMGVASVGYSGGELIVSVPAGGGAGDGYNILAAGTQTATTAGSVAFVNSNGITFGMSGSTQITASHNGLTTQTVQTQASGNIAGSGFTSTTTGGTAVVGTLNSNGLSVGVPAFLTTAMASNAATISNVNISAGTTSTNASAFTFANANGVSFGLGTGASAGSITASHNGLTSQSNQAFSASGGSSAFQTLNFANSNGLTFTNTNGSVAASYTVPTVTQYFSATNTTFNGTNASASITLNTNGLRIDLSAAAGGGGGTAATIYATGNTTQSSTGTQALSSLLVRGDGGVSAGVSNGSIVVSGPSLTSLSVTGALSASSNGSTISLGVGTVTATAASNTTQASSGTLNLNGLVFAGAGAASVGISGGSVVISAPNAGAGNVTFSAGANSSGLASVIFSNSNNVSFGLGAGSVITASAAGGGGGIGAGVSTFGNTAGSTGTVTTGNVIFVGSGPISLSQSTGAAGSNATITINAPATSSLVGTGGISISTNGSTISVSYTGGVLEFYQNILKGNNTSFSSFGQNTLHLQHFVPEAQVLCSFAEIWARGTFVSSTNSQAYSQTLRYGIYSQDTGANSTRMTLAGSSSVTMAVSYNSNTAYGYTFGDGATSFTSSSGGTALASHISGPIHYYMPFTTTLQPNVKHALAIAISSTTAVGTSPMRFAPLIQTVQNSLSYGRVYASAIVAPATSVIGDREMGIYTATTGALPVSYATSQISIAVSRQILPFNLEG